MHSARLDECVNILNEWHKVKVTLDQARQGENEIETAQELPEGEDNVQ